MCMCKALYTKVYACKVVGKRKTCYLAHTCDSNRYFTQKEKAHQKAIIHRDKSQLTTIRYTNSSQKNSISNTAIPLSKTIITQLYTSNSESSSVSSNSPLSCQTAENNSYISFRDYAKKGQFISHDNGRFFTIFLLYSIVAL